MQKISREFNFADASKLRKKCSEIEFNSEILGENEEKKNTLCLFKEHTCFLKMEDSKINLKIRIKTFSKKNFAVGQKMKNSAGFKFRG